MADERLNYTKRKGFDYATWRRYDSVGVALPVAFHST